MKKSLRNNREVAHVWAAQSQDEGYASHFFFEGPSLFSYGHHFEVARIVRPGVVLFNESSYSNSTSKHQGYARSAVSHMRVFRIPGLKWQAVVDHNASAEFYIQTLGDKLAYISRMRKDPEWMLKMYADMAEKAAGYVLEFGKGIRKPLQRTIADIYAARENPLTAEVMEKLKVRAAAERERAKAERLARAAADAARKVELQAEYDGWKAGTVDRLPWEAVNLFPVALRVHDDEIQTTKGAAVPVIEARKLWRALRTDAGTVPGMRVGHYTVTRIDPDHDSLIVGCHTIPLREVTRMAVRLGFEKAVA